ncbi:MAG: acyl-ACP--UDP-N-acetylglucosamine O-acyltransferase [Candidatus Eremiobacteraeota bacterium]|nr:acyl-ACP--UDP-N-acetylglucosamine O-acyltransferase [Candidatus Eremiobacteraeota bacterium]
MSDEILQEPAPVSVAPRSPDGAALGGRTALVHATALVHPSAAIGHGAEVGPFCIVGEFVRIGERTKLLANVVVNGHTTIGDDCVVFPFCSIGTASQDRKYTGERAFTMIGDRTVVREYCSINRATGENEVTSVGDDCLLLAYVHIAHNCRIGNGVTMSNLTQLAGHVTVEDFANIGGTAAAHQFVRIGTYAMVGGATKLTRDVPPFFLVEGNPAQVYGLNSVGLRRAQFSPEAISELKECYKIMYRSGRNISQALGELKRLVQTDAGRRLVAFIEAPSERGILK